MAKPKPPRTTPLTVRELIVELSKMDPSARVYYLGKSEVLTCRTPHATVRPMDPVIEVSQERDLTLGGMRANLTGIP